MNLNLDDNMRSQIKKLLPDVLKQKIQQSNYVKRRSAIRLASSLKRIDICSAQFAHIFHLSKHSSLEGKTCLEVGAGWVLTHALVCYLLGARRVIATDIIPFARPDAIPFALKNAIASLTRDVLAPFSDHTRIRERFNKLLSISHFSFDTLKELGIEYHSPIDFATEKLDIPIDFIYSHSVLEHVPYDDVQAILNNLVESLNQDGSMIHCIHLEDHKDLLRYPFDFLSIAANRYPQKLQSSRGNRIRSSEWEKIFSDIQGANTDFIYSYSRLDKALPNTIDPSISYYDEHDLRTSHIGVYTRKEK